MHYLRTPGGIGAGAMGSGGGLPRYMGTVSSCTTHVSVRATRPGRTSANPPGKGQSQAIGDRRGGDAATDHHSGDTSDTRFLANVEGIVEDLNAKRELFAHLSAISRLHSRVEHVVAVDCRLAAGEYPPRRRHAFSTAGCRWSRVRGPRPASVAETIFATAAAWARHRSTRHRHSFIVNRSFYGEALRLLAERGRAGNHRRRHARSRRVSDGPVRADGSDRPHINFAVTRNIWEALFYDPRFAPSAVQQERLAAGFLGRKSGRGFYRYGEGVDPPSPQTEPQVSKPARIIAHGEPGIGEPLVTRFAAAGVTIERAAANARLGGFAFQIAGSGGDAWLALSDGRTATGRAVSSGIRDLTVYDLAFDYAKSTRLAVARADTCSDAAFAAAAGALQAAGFAVSRFDDVAGLAVLRTVAMLPEAADAVVQGVAAATRSPGDGKGRQLSRGPLAWLMRSVGNIRTVLLHSRHYGEDRYRLSPLSRRALTGQLMGSIIQRCRRHEAQRWPSASRRKCMSAISPPSALGGFVAPGHRSG
jgi:3-hydroxybutyryl-CoA dehydrogenase